MTAWLQISIDYTTTTNLRDFIDEHLKLRCILGVEHLHLFRVGRPIRMELLPERLYDGAITYVSMAAVYGCM